MKTVKILCVVVLFAGIGQIANGQTATSKEQQAKRDQLRIAIQAICPVTGHKLGAMGAPLKVERGEQKEEVFLCCKSCANKKVDPKLWTKIHANFTKAQGKCLVMDKVLPKNPKVTIVNGQPIYICCPGCSKKLAATPEPYLQKLDGYYTAALKAKHGKHAGHAH